MLDHLREDDTILAWKLDRLSRSLKDVLHIMERIGAAGTRFRSLTEAIETTTPSGGMSGHKSGAEMARPCEVSEPTVSRIVAEQRQNVENPHAGQP